MEAFLVEGADDERLDISKLFSALSAVNLCEEDAGNAVPWVRHACSPKEDLCVIGRII